MPDEIWYSERLTVKEFRKYEGWVAFEFKEDATPLHIPQSKIEMFPFMKQNIEGRTIEIIGKHLANKEFPEIQNINFQGRRIYQKNQ